MPFSHLIRAQAPDYQFSKVSTSQGLSHNQASCILQDRKGFIWIGTLGGLNRYDGYSCKVYQHNYRDTTTLGNNHVTKLFEDPSGKIWVCTVSGISLFDPQTESFSHSPKQVLERYGIPCQKILDIYRDKRGSYWFISDTSGIYQYDTTTQRTKVLRASPQPRHSSLLTNRVIALQDDGDGHLWMLHTSGQLELLDLSTGRVIYRNATLLQQNKGKYFNYHIFQDSQRNLWIYSNEGQGLVCFNPRLKTFSQFHTHSPVVRLNNNIIRGVVEADGYIWVATDHGGINLIDKHQRTVTYLVQDPNDERSLSQNSITALYKDKQGIIWIGTYKKGVNYYHEDIFKFSFFRHQTGNPHSLPYNDINRFVEDAKGNLWIGTNGGGLLYFNRQQGTYTQYLHDPNNPASLSSNVVVSLCIDHQQKLWVGTYTGGLDCLDGSQFIHYQHDPNRATSISNNNIWEIMEDAQHRLWIGTNGGGLNLFDRQKNVFYHYRDQDANSIHSNYVTSLLQDKEGDIWIGTAYGLHKMNRHSGTFTHYLTDSNNPESLSNNNVNVTLEDSRGWIWIGTEEGLTILNKQTGKFRVLRKEDGLPDNTIQGIVEDNAHTIWLSTSNGLSTIHVRENRSQQPSFTFKNYDEQDGLQGNAFNTYEAYRTRAGELIFGGANGFNLFRPEKLDLAQHPQLILLTDLHLFTKSVHVGENIGGEVILPQALSDTRAITLRHDQNIFSIDFVALDYFHPDKNQYTYKLENFNQDWSVGDGKSRKATYMNLPPGDYLFRVKASGNATASNQEATLKITVLPPFWKTKPAYILYAFLIVGALILARILVLKRAHSKFQMEQERQETLRMHEMDLMKIKFFTNVSHEFKTPLSLILSPLESILKNPEEGDFKKMIPMVYRNARRLLNLINQLLDFRKMEMQQLKLYPTEGDIIQFIREATESFSDISEKKHIALTFQSSIEGLITFFDQDKLEKILFNLLSNAFKFTPGQGSVAVSVTFPEESKAADAALQWLRIEVQDTGIGIPADKVERIFERFFQNDIDGSMVNQGSGIGLSITKEFIRLHEGTIEVHSEPDKGSLFIVRLPVKPANTDLAEEVQSQLENRNASNELAIQPDTQQPIREKNKQKAVVLLVEDNEDFRFYLKDNLKSQYTILEAANGKEGWHLATTMLPDLVVSDVMMPELNGIELCRKIKNTPLTAHISVILLTARSTDEQKLEGLEVGVDDYITKPFNFEILHARIKNSIARKASERKGFLQPTTQPGEIAILSHEEKLVRKAYVLVEKNISNPEYSVEELGRDIGISRASLYKKLLSHTGKTPIEFIRVMRLRRAAELLESSQLTVSEVAYQVGFNNPKYFTKYFKTEYNLLPSHYIAQKRKV